MGEKRLIVDENYNLVDTVTGEWLDDTQVFDLANKLAEENKALKSDRTRYEEECRLDVFKELSEENEQLKQDIENLEITIQARETLIDVCEKKFKELGYIITVDDDGYVIE